MDGVICLLIFIISRIGANGNLYFCAIYLSMLLVLHIYACLVIRLIASYFSGIYYNGYSFDLYGWVSCSIIILLFASPSYCTLAMTISLDCQTNCGIIFYNEFRCCMMSLFARSNWVWFIDYASLFLLYLVRLFGCMLV